MFGWLAKLQGWERASLVGVLLGVIWILVFRAGPIVFGTASPSVQEVLGAVAGAFAIYFLALWAWGVRFVLPTWQEQRRARHPDGGDLLPWPLGSGLGLLLHLGLGGLEIALQYLPRSIPFLTGLPIRALRALGKRPAWT